MHAEEAPPATVPTPGPAAPVADPDPVAVPAPTAASDTTPASPNLTPTATAPISSPNQNAPSVVVEDVADSDMDANSKPAPENSNPSTSPPATVAVLVVPADGKAEEVKVEGEAEVKETKAPEEQKAEENKDALEAAPKPFVRPYDSSIDYYDCLEICHITASPSLQPLRSTPHKTIISSISCKPYLLFSSSYCFILDDGSGCHATDTTTSTPSTSASTTNPGTNSPTPPPTSPTERPKGKAIGYIIGTPSTSSFISIYKSDYLPLLDAHYPTPHPVSELSEHKCAWLLKMLFDPDAALRVPEFEDDFPAHFHIDVLPEWQSRGWGVKLLREFEGALSEERNKGGKVKGVHVGLDPQNDRAARWYTRNGFEERKVQRGGRYMVKRL